MKVTEQGYYWVKGNRDELTIAELREDDGIGYNCKPYLYWAIPFWECPCEYNEFEAVHDKPLQPPTI